MLENKYSTPELIIDGKWLRDEYGRVVTLRGVNLSGISKLPAFVDSTQDRQNILNTETTSFVGRPFPLNEAEKHFSRLRMWGFNFIRLLVTWEAIEHSGPGQYDYAYLEYLRDLVNIADYYGLIVCIDPHQDVWSRFSGGSGAPAWTLELAGFEISLFDKVGASIRDWDYEEPLPEMIWHSNSYKLAAATMFTLFFAGNHFAPKTLIDGDPIQNYLQRHYIAAFKQVARKLSGNKNVIGYGTMNEPMPGYIGWKSLTNTGRSIKIGPSPTPLQSMALGAGLKQKVNCWDVGPLGFRKTGTVLLNSESHCVWASNKSDIWQENGVWSIDRVGDPQIINKNYFSHYQGQKVDFGRDYYRPFVNRLSTEIRLEDPQAIIFVEPEPMCMSADFTNNDTNNILFAPHWYDGWVLFKKSFNPFFAVDAHKRRLVMGAKRIHRSFVKQLNRLKFSAEKSLKNAPVLLAEFGIPFDLNIGYGNQNNETHIAALDRSFRAIEETMIGCAIWNYNPLNDHDIGDGWNGEDLSIFSNDHLTEENDIYSGGRGLEAIIRPYVIAVAGIPTLVGFDLKKKYFRFVFTDENIDAPTIVFLPLIHYAHGVEVTVSDGKYEVYEQEQLLVFQHENKGGSHWIKVSPLNIIE